MGEIPPYVGPLPESAESERAAEDAWLDEKLAEIRRMEQEAYREAGRRIGDPDGGVNQVERIMADTVAEPMRGSVRRVYHETTDEHQKEAVCRNCGRDIETGWGYWTHSDDPSGRPECAQQSGLIQ